ncbi:MAG: PaaI family thioesterase [Syntrophomonas sp.]
MNAVNGGIDEKLFDYIVNSIKNTPYYQLLGIELTRLEAGNSELSVNITHQHTNPLGAIHGGLIMSLADAAMGNAIRSLGIKGVTVDCSTALIAAALEGEQVVARGRVLKAGKTMIFTEAHVWAGERLLSSAKGTFYKTGEMHF